MAIHVRPATVGRLGDTSIYVASSCGPSQPVFEKVGSALELIRSVDPLRFSRVQRDLRSILVTDIGVSSYSFATRTCTLDLRLVRDKSEAMAALTIVHEAVHARLYSAGIVTWRRIQPRIERICVREQIAFAGRLRDAGWGGTDEVIRALQRALENPWWTEERLFEARKRALVESDLPRWIVSLWIAMNRRRTHS